jgi:hypothetical protein
MTDAAEKTPGSDGKGGLGQGRSARRARTAVFVVLGGLALAAAVFLLARRGGQVPPLPRPELGDEQVSVARQELAQRVAGRSPTDDEQKLRELLERLNRAEAGARAAPESVVEVEGLVKAVGELASALAARDLDRYLEHGDALAVEFDRALERLLEEASRVGMEQARRSEAGTELDRLGGSFMHRALERGLIGEDGSLAASGLLPQVLFRVRWRSLARIGHREGLSPTEWKAHMDFVLKFSKPSSVEPRLQAIDEIARLEPGFDALLARAIVLHEGGRDDEAYLLLAGAIDSGRGDDAVRSFYRLLAP